MAEKEGGDVFFRGVLLYKPGPLTACQKCKAELKFESRRGYKRLDLYPIHGNRKLPGSPSTTIPLTNALGVINGKQHTITRAKYTFQVMTAGEHYQLSTLTEEEKGAWLYHLNLILNHIPVDNRTHEFHVSISPTTHSDKLQLTGQYILKVTETELRLFSASGALPSKFWSPLGAIRKAHHCLLPSSVSPPQPLQRHGMGGAPRNPSTQRLLVITTERTAPVGEGGFAFFTDSAKDIVATIMHRKELMLQTSLDSLSASLPQESNGDESSLRHQKLQKQASTPVSPSSETDLDFSATGREERARVSGEQSSLRRKCGRRHRKIPKSHREEKAKSHLRLQLAEGAEPQQDPALFTPDEPTHMAISELLVQRRKFKEWKEQMKQEEAKGKTAPRLLSPDSGDSRERWGHRRQRSSTVSTPTPDREGMSLSNSSVDCGYVTISRILPGLKGEGDTGEESLGKARGLERQRNMDLISPTDIPEEPDYVKMRPRTNAISYVLLSPTQPVATTSQTPPAQTAGGGSERAWKCDNDSCWLRPHSPPLIQQKSGSDPEMSIRTSSNASYLTILPPNPPTKKPKKPKPTPRSRKPGSIPLSGHTRLKMTLPTSALPGQGPDNPPVLLLSPHRGLDVRTLLSSQRSLSESNLFSAVSPTETDTEDDYVDMTHYRESWGHMYINYHDLLDTGCDSPASPQHHDDNDLMQQEQRRGMRRQASSSCSDLPTEAVLRQPVYENARQCAVSFIETDRAYVNGREAMRFYMYGCVGDEEEEEEFDDQSLWSGARGVVTALCCHGDSGLGSTPSSSPILYKQQRSFSMDDLRQLPSKSHPPHHGRLVDQGEPGRPAQPWQWQPCRAKVQPGYAHNHGYENLPLVA